MKTLRFLLLSIVLLLASVGTVSARAEGEAYAFVPLIAPGGMSTVPLALQARNSFERLAPALLQAQHEGSILEFQEDLAGGLLKIKYRAGYDISALVRQPLYSDIHAAAAAISPLQKSTWRANNPEITTAGAKFEVWLYSSCFSGDNLGNTRQVIGSLKDETGHVLASSMGYTDSTGYFYDCFDWTGSYNVATPSYRVTFKVYNGGTLVSTYVNTVPHITFTGVNKANNFVKGVSLPGAPYEAHWYHDNLDAANNSLDIKKTGTVPTTGKWIVDFGNTPMRGGDWITFHVQRSIFGFGYGIDVAYAFCILKSNYCSIHGFPGLPATITITHASKTYTYTGAFDSSGWYGVYLVKENLDPIFLAVGDKLTGTDVNSLTLPPISGVQHTSTDTVTGVAPANKYFYVYIYDVKTGYNYWKWVHSNTSKNYTANFSGTYDITADPLTLEVYYQDPATGNYTDYFNVINP